MSYSEQAEGINIDLINLFGNENVDNFTNRQKEQILDIIIRFGRVAKFRCRSNTAFLNFSNECFKNIADVKTIKVEGKEYETFRTTLCGDKNEI